jgi:hypothetical protein
MNHHWSHHHHHETTRGEDATDSDRVVAGEASADDPSESYESVFENPAQLGTVEFVDLELARINPPV